MSPDQTDGRRRIARDVGHRRLLAAGARAGTILCSVGLGITAFGMSFSGVPVASAATDGGPAQIVTPFDAPSGAGQPLTTGASATAFSILLPAGAACTGDSANDGYRIQGYMVPSAVDPATLTFAATGPLPSGLGDAFRQPLYETTGTGYVDVQTANATAPGGPGPIVNVPAFDLGVFVPGNIPAGAYNVGVACTKGTASATQLDRYWNAQVTVAEAPADVPAGVTWTAAAPPPTTTSTTAPTSSTSSTSTSTSSSSTSSSSTSSTSTSSSSTSTSSSSTSTTAPTSTTSVPVCTSTTVTTTPATSTTSSTSSTTSSSTTSSTSTTTTSTTAPTTTSTTTPTTTSSTSTSTSSTVPLTAQAAGRPVLFTAACVPAGTTVSSTVAVGGQLTISSTGWKAASEVSAVLHSDPVDLGKLVASSSGRIAGSLTVPATVPPGEHELVLAGRDATDVARTIRVAVTVTGVGDDVTTSIQPGSTEGGTFGGGLPRTGSSTVALLAWAGLLVVCGRMAVLLGRPLQVLPPAP